MGSGLASGSGLDSKPPAKAQSKFRNGFASSFGFGSRLETAGQGPVGI
jgi:hypothetical protein